MNILSITILLWISFVDSVCDKITNVKNFRNVYVEAYKYMH